MENPHCTLKHKSCAKMEYLCFIHVAILWTAKIWFEMTCDNSMNRHLRDSNVQSSKMRGYTETYQESVFQIGAWSCTPPCTLNFSLKVILVSWIHKSSILVHIISWSSSEVALCVLSVDFVYFTLPSLQAAIHRPSWSTHFAYITSAKIWLLPKITRALKVLLIWILERIHGRNFWSYMPCNIQHTSASSGNY